jgi:hypothetical protein
MTSSPRSWTTGLGLKAVVALLLSTLLVSCGSSKKYQEFMPTRIISMGDALSYTDFTTGSAVNTLTSIDPSTTKTDHWLWDYAAAYGLSSIGAATGTTAAPAGKNVVMLNTNSYHTALGCAAPTATGANAARCALGLYDDIAAQVLPSPQEGDLVVLTVGMGDIFAMADTAFANGDAVVTSTDLANAKNIGLKYINLADSIYQRGYKHVLILTPVDYSTSPYAIGKGGHFSANLKQLTEALSLGTNVNCNGGCTLSDNKPYPTRAEGVWRQNIGALLSNIINLGRNAGYLQTNVNNNPPTTSAPLCAYPTDLTTCTPNALTDGSSLPYFYSGDFFMSPTLHRYVATYMYNLSRGFSGF